MQTHNSTEETTVHAPDENLQVSFWLTPTTARKLADDLQELADGMEVDR